MSLEPDKRVVAVLELTDPLSLFRSVSASSCIFPSPGDQLFCLHGSTAAKDEQEEIDTAILPASSPEILPYIRLKNVTASVTASVTNCRGRVIFEAIVSQSKWKDNASNPIATPFFNRLVLLEKGGSPRDGKTLQKAFISWLTPFHIMLYTQVRWCVVRSGAQCSGFTDL